MLFDPWAERARTLRPQWTSNQQDALARALRHAPNDAATIVIAQCVKASLFLALIEEHRPLRDIAQVCDIDADYLGWLLRAGRIAGQKRRGRWYTSTAAVRRYQQEVASGAVPVGRPRRPR